MFLFRSNFVQKMSRNPIKISDNLLLRRIDPVIMLRRYLAGDFKTLTPPKSKITLSKTFTNLSQRIGADQTSEIYRFNDKTNSGQVIVTTNHEQYHYAKEGKDAGGKEPIAYCDWCKRIINTKAIGIPISMEIDKSNNTTVFHIEDTYDTFGCALMALKEIYLCHYMYKDPLYMDAEQMLHCMYHKMHPDKIGTRIKPAKHWKLLKINKGPMNDEEFDNDQCEYVQLPNIILVPIKRQYVKLVLGKKN